MVCSKAFEAKTLSFVQPTTGKRLSFDSEITPDMAALLDKWRGYEAARGTGEE